MSATTTIEPRLVKRGTLNETTGIYTLYLDNGTEVDTESTEVAETASKAAKAGKLMVFETEARGGRNVITQMSPAPAPEQSQSQKPDAVARTEPAATRPIAAQGTVKRPELPTGLISDPQALTTQMTALQAHYNVLSPAISISQMAPGYGANLAVVQIDPSVEFDEYGNGAGPDCYFSKSLLKDASKRALNKQGLLKIAQAAGIQWMPAECRRLDDGKERNFWNWKYFGYVRTHDGQLMPVSGSRELDLRDGAAEAIAMKGPQLTKARASGNQICETKAMERAIRTLGIRQVYTVDELRKPFLIVRFSFTPDMNDPEIKKLVTQQAMGGIGQLYAPPAAAMLPAAPEEVADLSIAGQGQAMAAAAPAKRNPFADDAPEADAGETLPDGTTTIVKVNKASGAKTTNGKSTPWTKYDVTFATGEIATTFSQTIQQLVDDAERQKAPVRIETSPQEGYNDKIERLTIIDKRQQSLPVSGEERY